MEIITNVPFVIDAIGETRSKYASEFAKGDVIIFSNQNDKTIITKNGRKIKHEFDKRNLRMFEHAVQLQFHDVKKSNVFTKAFNWSQKVFGEFAPENEDAIVAEVQKTGWTPFKAAARIAAKKGYKKTA